VKIYKRPKIPFDLNFKMQHKTKHNTIVWCMGLEDKNVRGGKMEKEDDFGEFGLNIPV
jgi:hypothetical protein